MNIKKKIYKLRRDNGLVGVGLMSQKSRVQDPSGLLLRVLAAKVINIFMRHSETRVLAAKVLNIFMRHSETRVLAAKVLNVFMRHSDRQDARVVKGLHLRCNVVTRAGSNPAPVIFFVVKFYIRGPQSSNNV